MTRPVGLVLAGGRSTRFGAEKAVVEVGGAPMMQAAIEVLGQGCRRIAVSAPAGSRAADYADFLELPVLPDGADHPKGPLAGVAAGLAWAEALGAAALVTTPCDTPYLPSNMVRRLLDAPPAPVVIAETADGPHPLCALWRIEVLAPLRAQLAGEHGRVMAFIASQGFTAVLFDQAQAFANINSPGDLVRP